MQDKELNETIDSRIDVAQTQALFNVAKVPVHTHNGLDSSILRVKRYEVIRLVAAATDNATGTVVGGDFVMPFAGTLTGIGATVDTAGTTNKQTMDVKKNGTSIMTTKITIDSGTKTSRVAAIPPVINPQNNNPNFAVGDIFTFNVDVVQTTPAKGLTIFMNCGDGNATY